MFTLDLDAVIAYCFRNLIKLWLKTHLRLWQYMIKKGSDAFMFLLARARGR